jgi:hypothetical protein
MTSSAAATAHKIAVQQKPRMKWVQKTRNPSETNGSASHSADENGGAPESPSNRYDYDAAAGGVYSAYPWEQKDV